MDPEQSLGLVLLCNLQPPPASSEVFHVSVHVSDFALHISNFLCALSVRPEHLHNQGSRARQLDTVPSELVSQPGFAPDTRG